MQQGVKHAESNLRTTVRILHLFICGRWRNTCSTVASLIISSQARTFMPGLQSLTILTKGNYLNKRGLCRNNYILRWWEHILYRTTGILFIHWSLTHFYVLRLQKVSSSYRATEAIWSRATSVTDQQRESRRALIYQAWYFLHLLSEWWGKTPNEWPRFRNTTASRYPAKNYGRRPSISSKIKSASVHVGKAKLAWVQQVLEIPSFTKCLNSVPLNTVIGTGSHAAAS